MGAVRIPFSKREPDCFQGGGEPENVLINLRFGPLKNIFTDRFGAMALCIETWMSPQTVFRIL
jgi:hypothetical protein